jgi:hypothetical protein
MYVTLSCCIVTFLPFCCGNKLLVLVLVLVLGINYTIGTYTIGTL